MLPVEITETDHINEQKKIIANFQDALDNETKKKRLTAKRIYSFIK